MGEIADMMLEGVLCEGCGEYLGPGNGFPRYCKRCQPPTNQQTSGSVKVPCPKCGKKVKTGQGLKDHMKNVHKIT